MALRPRLDSARLSPVLVYLVTQDWYFMAHRVPMALAAQRAGYDVHVVTHVDKHRAAIEALGFRVHAVDWQRGSINPFAFLNSIRDVRRHYKKIAPDLVHHVALQPTIVGSLAASGLGCIRVNALTGLGFVFTSAMLKARLVRPIFRALLRYVLRDARAAVLVENPDDHAAVRALGAAEKCVFTMAGSGIETDKLTPLPEPPGPITMAYAGRLIKDKGVHTLVTAHEILEGRGALVRLLIAGEPDPANPASIPREEINDWSHRPGITLLGHVADIRDVWKSAHIAVLVSRREGLPMSLLEAAACGRPLVASDVPGCREVARPGINALLVPPDDARALADAIAQLCGDSGLRRKLGEGARRMVESEYSAERVGSDIVALYNRLLSRKEITSCQ
jgi:glycosyltransferase involved in cell wall biosynthesis